MSSELTVATTLPLFPTDGSLKTLGWEIASWVEDYLLQPDGDDAGEAFQLTREQLSHILYFYALDDEGRFLYRRAVLRRAKGWGKSPFLGAVCLAELLGPVRFGGWDAHGDPVGVRHPAPWVVVAGVSETQTENTLAAIRSMVEESELVAETGLDVGITRLLLPGGGKLQPITANAATQEGARPSFAVMDETHHWTATNGGHKLARVVRRNLAKSRDGSARSIETTNAHEPGQDTVAEKSFEAFLSIREGRSRDKGLLYDSREPVGDVDLADDAQLRAGLRAAYGDSSWIDLDRIVGEVWDPGTPPEEARRFYLNQIVAAADSWVSAQEWDRNVVELEPLRVAEPGDWKKGDAVALGFDGSLRDDSTALVAVRISDGAPFVLGLWEKPDGPAGAGWEIDKGAVRGVVDHTFSTLDVVAFFADLAYWETDVDSWRETYGDRLLVKATTKHSVSWDMRTHQLDTTRATEALWRAIVDGELPHDGELRLRRHVLNARRRPNRWGVSFGKESRESSKKVDALAALVLARMARSRVLAENVLTKRRPTTGRLVGF